MNVLFSIHLYPPQHLCGAEFVAHSIAKHFQKKGDTVKVLLNQANHYRITQHYIYDGVDVFPPDENISISLFRWADIIFTHLDYTRWTINMAKIFRKPVFHLIHNTHPYASIIDAEEKQFIIYNSENARKKLNYKHESIVLSPPVDYRHYRVNNSRNYYTLINLNENKGADVFYKIAEAMPDREFLGVQGSYDQQLTGKILSYDSEKVSSAEGFIRKNIVCDKTPPNVTLWPKQIDIRDVYKVTKVLLMPSRYESYGRTSIEAMSSGIPVICTSTSGLVEACKDAAIYINKRDDINEWVDRITELDKEKTYQAWADKGKARAEFCDPQKSLDRLYFWAREKNLQYHTRKLEVNGTFQ